ncbi:MinD/ParA family ATP-binding protein [Halorientalis pallida]|uniref:Septum site-determining protein MinD n=1 Tax=Halorientalis pallida TaxID=2479928 RepID=A0A498L0P6_9EURY|nr:P-loop NTPase [Halorientalis pallida]RXK51858.1 septum site-determining protein MinD [Halorientalis pallida]
MAGDVYTVAGGKGGVGKTTTAVNTAIALQDAGRRTVVVDADLGMTNLSELLGLEHEPRLHDVLAGEAELGDAIAEGPSGLSVLAGRGTLESFAEADPSNLRPVLRALQRSYEAVIVDTGAGLSHETLVPAGMSDGIVLVTTPDEVSLTDARKVGELADHVDGSIVGAVLTKVRDDIDVSAVGEELGEEILGVVPQDDEATANEPLVVTSPDSYAAQAYRRLGTKLADWIDDSPVERPVES